MSEIRRRDAITALRSHRGYRTRRETRDRYRFHARRNPGLPANPPPRKSYRRVSFFVLVSRSETPRTFLPSERTNEPAPPSGLHEQSGTVTYRTKANNTSRLYRPGNKTTYARATMTSSPLVVVYPNNESFSYCSAYTPIILSLLSFLPLSRAPFSISFYRARR